MDINRTINKVVNKSTLHDETLLDLTNDTVQEQNLLINETAHNRDGNPVVGDMVPVTDYEQLTGKPKINNVELSGNKTSQNLGLVGAAEKGQANGVASLNESGKVPAEQLPSFVDDTVEGYLYEGAFYKDAEHTELITGESGKIYVDLVSDHSFRWSGSAYVDITDPDVENSIVHSIADSQDLYPVPANGETIKVIIGKIKKYLSDLKTDKLDKTGEGKDVIVTYANEGTDSEITSGTKLSKIIAQIAYKFANYKFGHVIKNSSGAVTQRGALKFTGLTVTDDSTNEQTVVDGSGKFDSLNVSTIEDTLTASKNYSAGDPFIYNGQLYKATENIVSGGTIILSGTGANATETTIEELITEGSVSGVSGVKGNAEQSYRTGNVNITPANVGAVASSGGEAGDTVVTFTDPSADGTITSGSTLKTIIGLIKYKFAHLINGHTIVNSSGTSQTARTKLKFTGNVTVTDDSSNDQTVINMTGGGSGGHTILNSSGTAMTARGKLQFVGATVTDDSANDKTIITTTPQSMIGDAWVSGHVYAVGDYCIYNNIFYKCKTAHTSTSSNYPSSSYGYWTVDTVANELLLLSNKINSVLPNFFYIYNRGSTNYSWTQYYYRGTSGNSMAFNSDHIYLKMQNKSSEYWGNVTREPVDLSKYNYMVIYWEYLTTAGDYFPNLLLNVYSQQPPSSPFYMNNGYTITDWAEVSAASLLSIDSTNLRLSVIPKPSNFKVNGYPAIGLGHAYNGGGSLKIYEMYLRN